MSINDPISDMFTRVRNSIKEKHESVTVPYSKLLYNIAYTINQNGFFNNVSVVNSSLLKKSIKIILKYDQESKSTISNIQRISKPSKRIYLKKAKIPKILGGFGISILSTSKGIMSGKEARVNNLGGEFLGVVW